MAFLLLLSSPFKNDVYTMEHKLNYGERASLLHWEKAWFRDRRPGEDNALNSPLSHQSPYFIHYPKWNKLVSVLNFTTYSSPTYGPQKYHSRYTELKCILSSLVVPKCRKRRNQNSFLILTKCSKCFHVSMYHLTSNSEHLIQFQKVENSSFFFFLWWRSIL